MLVNRSKTGLPTISESGGGSTNTGNATIICGSNGEKVKPLFVPRGYSNGEHAIFVAKVGMCVIDAGHSRSGEWATIKRIVAIGTGDSLDELVLKEIGSYENGDGNIPESFQDVVKVALKKSSCYHCRESHYSA